MTAPDPRSLSSRLTLKVPEAAALLGIDDSAYRAVANGDIPALRVGRRWLVPVGRLLELLGDGGRGDAA